MKRIVISGPSGSGKSTYINSIKDKINVIPEMDFKNPSILKDYYELAKQKNQKGKNLFISLMMKDKKEKYSFINEDTVFDRSIIDYIVAAELRIKPNDKVFFSKIKKQFNSYIKEIKNILPFYIILETNFKELKKRIIERGREDEVNNIINNDDWYRNYHKMYSKTLIKYLKKLRIDYIVIDTTHFSKIETMEKINKHIFNNV